MRFCAFADEASPYIGGQIRALERNCIFQLEIRGVDGRAVDEDIIAGIFARFCVGK